MLAVCPQASGVHVKGFAPSLNIMQQYRVCLAPLRFGAGLKGKIVDSWAHGLPVCTTPVGAEGMFPPTSQTPLGYPDTQVQLHCLAKSMYLLLLCYMHYALASASLHLVPESLMQG